MDIITYILCKGYVNKKINQIMGSEPVESEETEVESETQDKIIRKRVYHADLSLAGSFKEILIRNVIYRLQYGTAASLSLYLKPNTVPILIDLKRSSQYDLTTIEGFTRDNYTLSASLDIDTIIFNSSREMNQCWLRQKDPYTNLWSMDEINLFVSNGNARVTIWVKNIYTNVKLD